MPAEVSNPQSVAGDDPARVADGRGNALDAFGDDLLVLDVVARGVDDAGHEDHAVGEGMAREARVLVGVAGVRHRQHEGTDLSRVEQRKDVVERDVVGVRSFVVAPADVKAHSARIDARERVVRWRR